MLNSFFLALSLWPNVQRKAQAEIDNLGLAGQLPSLADRDKLPYVQSLVKEVMRSFPSVPLGMCSKKKISTFYNSFEGCAPSRVSENLTGEMFLANIHILRQRFLTEFLLRTLIKGTESRVTL